MYKLFVHKFLYKVNLFDFLLFRILPAVPIAVEEVDDTADDAPYPEALPSHAGKIIHDVSAAQNRERSYDIDGGAAEGTMGIWVFIPQNHNPY